MFNRQIRASVGQRPGEAERYSDRRIVAPPNEQETRKVKVGHSRSKNNHGARRNDPETDWSEYNRDHR